MTELSTNKKLLLSRTYKPNLTMSSVYALNGEELLYRCKALELPWLNNQRNVSCIAEGEYWAVKEIHPTRGKVFRLLYVRGRSGILVHKGNFVAGYVKDSEGCILPGLYHEDINGDGNMDVAESGKAMDADDQDSTYFKERLIIYSDPGKAVTGYGHRFWTFQNNDTIIFKQ